MRLLKPKHCLWFSLGLLAGCESGSVSNRKTEAGPLFQQLTSDQTGIHFNNELVDTKAHNILLYANYYGGAGVGVGDFNKDGLADLYFAGNLVDDRLYLNKGNFRFEDISGTAKIQNRGSWSSGVIVADVNGDGWEDIYVTCELYDDQPHLRANKLYINQKDMTFTEEAAQWGISDTARTRHATFLDYDNDGDPDLFTLNQPPNAGNCSPFKNADINKAIYSPRLYRNTGSKFEDVTKAAGVLRAGFPNSATAADFDKDGYTDIYVANDFEAPDFFYHNNGDGTFTDILAASAGHTSFYSMGVDAADINNDGLEDLMVLDMVAEDNFRLKANMSGMNPENFWSVVRNGGHYQYMFNTLFLNRGQNTLSDVAQYAGVAATDWSWSNLIVDLDNDGLKDLYITNGLVRDIRNSDAEKEFSRHVVQASMEFIQSYPDSTNVSVLDIIDLEEALQIIPSEKLVNYAYRNMGGLKFEKVMKPWGLNQKSFSNGSAYADLNNDGFLDLIVNNINEEAFIFKNRGAEISTNHYLRLKLEDPGNRTIFGTEVTLENEDGTQFISLTNVRGMYSTSEQIAHFGLGDQLKADKITVKWPDGTVTLLQDVDVDQLLTVTKSNTSAQPKTGHSSLLQLVVPNNGLDFKHKENYFDDYKFQALLPHKLSHFGPASAVGDVNGDGLNDIFIGGASGQSGKLFFTKADGSFDVASQQPWQRQSIMEDVDATFFDVDGDLDLDLYIGSGGNEFEAGHAFYQDRLYINDGSGGFTYEPQRLPPFNISTGVALPFDFDADGDPDLFVGERFVPRDYPRPGSGYLLENKEGKFLDVTKEKATNFKQLGLITDAISTDIDQNGEADLIITGEWMAPRIFLNQNATLDDHTASYGLDTLQGWWFSINKGDFDQDGDDDFVLGNLGLNYKYKASSKEPFEVFYNDFDDNGSQDIVLSYYNFGEQFPVRGRSCSSRQVPALAKKFDTYELFASSSLRDIYASEKLNEGLRLTASHFESVYVENIEGKQLKTTPLPAMAQHAPIQDSHFSDINGDGHLDILYGGNLYVSEIETTRADAGVGGLLLGNGKGGFKPLSSRESGIYVPKDIREIEQIQIRDQRLWVFVTNDDAPVFLQKSNL